MQSINFSNDMSLHTHKANGGDNKFLRWLPLAVLVAAVVAAVVLGSANKSTDELDWLSRLAAQGDSGAQLQLGLAYRDGRYGLTPDAKTAFYWLKQSADANNAYAEDAVANAYAKGQGVEKDLEAAKLWWNKSMQRGDKDARIHMSEELLQEGNVTQAEGLLK